MTLHHFVNRLNIIEEKSAIQALICDFINDHVEDYEDAQIRKFIDELQEERFTAFGYKLGHCRNYCLNESQNEENKNEKNYLGKLSEVTKLLNYLSTVYQDKINEKKAASPNANETAALSQQKDVLREINTNIRTFKSEIAESKAEMRRISETFNDKIFSVLINTVSLLGIFVTIAFAGFGVATIFSNIDFKAAMESEEAFVKNIFYILLTAWLSFNLLLLLIYFIFRIARPIILQANNKTPRTSFSLAMNLKPFLWIDAIWGVLNVIIFVVCVVVW